MVACFKNGNGFLSWKIEMKRVYHQGFQKIFFKIANLGSQNSHFWCHSSPKLWWKIANFSPNIALKSAHFPKLLPKFATFKSLFWSSLMGNRLFFLFSSFNFLPAYENGNIFCWIWYFQGKFVYFLIAKIAQKFFENLAFQWCMIFYPYSPPSRWNLSFWQKNLVKNQT